MLVITSRQTQECGTTGKSIHRQDMVSGVKTDRPMFSRQAFHAYNGTNIELLNTMMVYN